MKIVRATKEQSGLTPQEKLSWLRLARTENVGPITFYRLIETYGSAGKALEELPHLSRRGGRMKPLTAPPLHDIEREYDALKKFGGDYICAADESYPLALAAIDDPPPIISYIGDKALMHKSCVGIVGSRNASLNGRKFTERLAADLGAAGITVVSGLARGVDTAAHEGSLKTGTIAVVAGGIDVVYPQENKALYQNIQDNGLILAESMFGQQPFAQSFPRRNRIVSGLSQGVVVVEATLRSGSLITARLAGEQGRDVYAVPGHPMDPRAEGTNTLLRDGAILIRNAADIIETLNHFRGPQVQESIFQHPYNPLPPAQTIDESAVTRARDDLLSHLSPVPTGIDELVRASGLSAAVVQVALLELELADRLQRLPGHRVALIGA